MKPRHKKKSPGEPKEDGEEAEQEQGAGGGPHQGDVAVVPGVVVHQRGPVGHPRDLVAVVPPGHDAGVLVRVLPQPVVGLPEVVQDVPRPAEGEQG